jgi:integrase/recombinase XerD
MTPLRQRLIDDMRLRNYSDRTIDAYVSAVARFAKFSQRSPDQLGAEHVRKYQLHLLSKGASWSQFNQIVCGLRFFYAVTLGQPELVKQIPYGKKPKALPVVLSPDEVVRLFEATLAGRDRMMLQTAYACGLRVSELVHLRITDIDSARHVVQVRQGKGQKDRQVPLSGRLLEELRQYWRRYRPQMWLFPGQRQGKPMSVYWPQRLIRRAAIAAGLSKHVTMHTLRHSYATHMLEAGIDVVTLQRLLGHRDLQTTTRYLHISTRQMQNAPSLLDLLGLPTKAAEQP